MTNINRDSEGKFTSSKWFVTKFLGLPVLFVIVGVGLAMYYQHQHPNIITNTIEKDISPEMYAQKIDSLEKNLVEQVRSCESEGFKESDGLVTYDPKLGGKNDDKAMSYGTLQFKKATVIYYEKTLFNKVVTGKEAILIALDYQQSGELAQAIMFQSKNMATDWINCSTRLNLNVMIQAIKKIK